MADYILQATITADDQASAGADAAAAALLRAADAADRVEVSTTRAGKSAGTYANQLDPVSAALRNLQLRMADAAAAQAALQTGLDAGTISQDTFARPIAGAPAPGEAARPRLARGRATTVDYAGDTRTATGAVNDAAAAHGSLGGATAGVTRELLVLGHEAVTGNYTRMGGSLIVLAERTNALHAVLSGIGPLLASTGGAFALAGVAAVAALGVMSYGAESAASQLADLSAHLRVTRTDYEALAAAGEKTARAVSSTSTIGTGDAKTAYSTLAAVPNYGGTNQDLQDLIRLSGDVAKAFGEDVPKAATRLAAGLLDPTAAAKKLADEGFTGMDQAGAKAIERLQASGQIAAAQTALMDAYKTSLKGAAEDGATPLQTALHQLEQALTSAGANGKSLGREFGEAFSMGVATLVTQITELLHAAQAVRDWIGRGGGAGPVVDQNTGAVPNVSADLQRVAPDTLNKIYSIAEANGIDAKIADLATRVAYQESHGFQTNGTGGLLTSSAGAVGVMQLMPGTAAGRDINPNGNLNPANVDDNILLGLRYLAQLSQRFGSDADIAGAYNLGPGGYASYQAGRRNLPQETQDYVHNVAGVALPINLAAGASTSIDVSTRSAAVEAALKLPNSTTLESLDKADEKITLLVHALGDLSARGETSGATWDTLTAQLAKARGEYSNIGTAVDLSNRKVTDGLIPLGAATGAARVLATAQNELTLAARAAGEDVTQEQRTARNTAEQTKLTAAFNDGLDALNKATAGQVVVNAAYDQGARSVVEAQNAVKAHTETLATSVEGTAEFTRQEALKKDALDRSTAAMAEANTAARGFAQKDQLDTIRLETSLLGANADVQARELALLKERQTLIQNGGAGAVNTASGQASLARVAEIQDETAAYNRQKQTFDELASVGTNAFDQIGNSITQAFANGTLKTLSFSNVVKAAFASLAQEALKLAIINPLTNALFGTTKSTVSNLGGVLGLLGGAAGAGTLAVSNQATTSALTFTDGSAVQSVAPGASTATPAAAGGIGVLGGAKIAYDLGKLAFGQLGIGGGAGVAEAATAGITSLLGNAATATNTALTAAGEGVYGVATAGQVAVASVTQAAGLSTQAAATAVTAASTIASAVPYIGAAIGVVTDLAQGNYKGAGLVLGGAAIGTAIAPGIGTAIGAAVGGLVDMFTAGHKQNPFQSVDVGITNGQLATGAVKSQLEDPTAIKASVDAFSAGVNQYMAQTGLKLANADGRVGIVSDLNSNKDVTYSKSVLDLFKTLRFTDSTNDGSNFSVAKAGALPGQQFDTLDALNASLVKIANFSDGVDRLGLQLKSVGNDLTSIQIAGLKDGRAPSSALETAFAHALPGQTFATADAFQAEITKINNFVNGTLPSLLDPVIQTPTQLQTSIAALAKTYSDAIAQAQQYGLATDGLVAAQGKAIAMLQAPALKDLALSNLAITQRGLTAAGQDTSVVQLQTFDLNAEKQRQALVDQYTNIYGTHLDQAKDYSAAVVGLDKTLAVERLALIKQFNDAAVAADKAAVQAARSQTDASQSVFAAGINIQSRQDVLNGNQQASDLNTYNLKAIAETTAYQRQLVDFYGVSFLATQDYQNRMTALQTVQEGERLAIAKKYADAITATHNTIAGLVTNLTTYAQGLQTSALSPLSAQSQLTLARNQFQAVAGAAAAGDYNSTQKLQTYSDSFLNASRAVNGSGAAYVADFNKVLDALNTVATAPVDTLTASYQASLVQNQTDQLVTELRALKAEVAALRKETGQNNAAPARVAA